ncbi:hypothetical protein Dimus_035099 [Dionaea muscipula]
MVKKKMMILLVPIQAMLQLLVVLVLVCRSVEASAAGLAYNYYETSCPNVEDIIRREMCSILASDVLGMGSAAFLRLLFHDCQVQGCDASILLDGTDSEMSSTRNFGIRKREEIGQMKSNLEKVCPGQVSCADIIALAAREAVSFAGGPHVQIPLGRRDSTTSSHLLADSLLPSPRINVDQLLHIFSSQGMKLEESVAILGAHTLGAGHCLNIADRLYNPDPLDEMDFTFELSLRLLCPTRIPITNLTTAPNDSTPTLFDNHYYRDISSGRGLFGVDSSLSRDPRTAPIVAQFSVDLPYFFQTFSSAFVKLSSANVLTGNLGEIRRSCNQVN